MIKARYQYTNFIYPFIIEEDKYAKYIAELLCNKNCRIRLLQKEKDLNLYSYFTENIKKYFFPTFEYNTTKIKDIEKEKDKKIISSLPCAIFDYDIGKDVFGKTDKEDSIFFKITRIEIICFNTGICFLNLKTYIDDIENFTDILNYNYKFKGITKEKAFNDGIKIQTDVFDSIKQVTDLVKGITKKEYIEQNFLMQGYACIDAENWNEKNDFSNIENSFYKYIYAVPYDQNTEFDRDNIQSAYIVSDLKYSKCGITAKTANLLVSSIETYNYTKLIEDYNNQYFYTYIIEIYKKMYLQKLLIKIEKNTESIAEELLKFKDLVIEKELTKDIFGLEYSTNIQKALGTPELYNKVQEDFVLVAERQSIKKADKVNRWILIALCFSLIVNIVNFLILFSVL